MKLRKYLILLLCISTQMIQSLPVINSENEFLNYVKNLVESGGEVNQELSTKEEGGFTTLLHIAVQNDYKESTRYLLSNGANVNKVNAHGRTPLHDAAEGHYSAIADMLIANRANVNVQDSKGQTPLHALFEFNVDASSLIIAQKLLYAGASINIEDSDHDTPLMLVASTMMDSIYLRQIIDLLLDNNVDCNQIDECGNSPLHIAVQDGVSSVVKKLLEGTLLRTTANANPNIQNDDGDTALHIACLHGKLEEVYLLLIHGGNLSIKNNKGQVPLMAAIEEMDYIDSCESSYCKKEKEVFKLLDLLIHDPAQNFTVYDEDKKSLLHYAALHDYTSKLLSFVLHVAPEDINARDIHQKTPLYYALERGNFSGMIKLLLNGAQAAVCDQHGITPLAVLLSLDGLDADEKLKYARILISYCGSINPYLLCKKEPTSLFIDTLSQEEKSHLGIDDLFIAKLKSNEFSTGKSSPFLKGNQSDSNVSSMVRLLLNREIGSVSKMTFFN